MFQMLMSLLQVIILLEKGRQIFLEELAQMENLALE